MRNRSLIPLAVILLIATVIALGGASAYPGGGVANNGRNGCVSCHGTVPRSSTIVHLDSAPVEYEPGKSYSLTVRVEAENVRPTGYRAGFAVEADGGKLAVTDPTQSWVYHNSATITQTTAGSEALAWNLSWTAPTNGSLARIYYTGLVVPSDARSLADDPWNSGVRLLFAKTEIETSEPTAPEKAFGPSSLATLLVLGLLAFTIRRRRP